jgi:hypothetical protein
MKNPGYRDCKRPYIKVLPPYPKDSHFAHSKNPYWRPYWGEPYVKIPGTRISNHGTGKKIPGAGISNPGTAKKNPGTAKKNPGYRDFKSRY